MTPLLFGVFVSLIGEGDRGGVLAIALVLLIGALILIPVRDPRSRREPAHSIHSADVPAYGRGILRKFDAAISTMWPTPPSKTVRAAALEKPSSWSMLNVGGIDSAFGSVMNSTSTGPS